MKRTTHKAKVSKSVLAVLLTLTVVFFIGCGKKDTPSKTPSTEPTKVTGTPTAEPTKTVTDAPTVTPTATEEPTPTAMPTPTPIVYGDLTQYLDRPASELIDIFGDNFQYEFTMYDSDPGTYSRINYTPEVKFCLVNESNEFSPSHIATVIRVDNNAEHDYEADLGFGLNLNMTCDEILETFGDSLLYGPREEWENKYKLYGIFHGCTYEFIWDGNPKESQKPADYVLISKSGLVYAGSLVLGEALDQYYSDNKTQLEARGKQLKSELRAACKEQPVSKYALLSSVKMKDGNTFEIYEYAAYGYLPAYKALDNGTFSYSGVDKSKEFYQYAVVGRVLADGRTIRTGSRDIDYSDASISGALSWTSENLSRDEAIGEMIGLPIDKTDDAISTVKLHQGFRKKENDYEVDVFATYQNEDPEPIVTRDLVWVMRTESETNNEHIYTPSDKDGIYNKDLKTIKEGSGVMQGKEVSWELLETAAGSWIVRITERGDWWYKYSYFYSDNRLILYRIEVW